MICKELKSAPVVSDLFKNWTAQPNAKLTIFTNSVDPASTVYVRNKKNKCEEYGIQCEVIDTVAMSYGSVKSAMIQAAHARNFLLFQKPVAKHLRQYEQQIDRFISAYPAQDIDAFNGDLSSDFKTPCTPLGIMKLLDYYHIDLDGKNVVVLGRSKIVGKPVADLLLRRNATVTICHSKTQMIDYYTKHADVIVVAVGKKDFLKAEMIKEGAVVIDVGINRKEDGHICGDCQVDEAFINKVGAYTPVPGGVGPLTVAMLVWKMGE